MYNIPNSTIVHTFAFTIEGSRDQFWELVQNLGLAKVLEYESNDANFPFCIEIQDCDDALLSQVQEMVTNQFDGKYQGKESSRVIDAQYVEQCEPFEKTSSKDIQHHSQLMDNDTFWALVDRALLASKGDYQKQIFHMTELLGKLFGHEILQYDNRFTHLMDECYDWNIWAAAWIIDNGCNDTEFVFFRTWLVAQGKEVFEGTLKDVNTLLDIATPGIDREGFAYCADDAYESVTKNEMPLGLVAEKSFPSGKKWEIEDLPDLYPRLYLKFRS